ncbi:glycoside hydrolase family protein [Vibrio breoganii]|uniref:Lysozyme n=1 Tax=Vibrio breoganii TaxID=553239 RepID=A0AAP8MWT0_9VIBR|nr:glycoside hydrolase family protein [Vibrio breoganii]PMP10233.1 hypothetical protein BCS93_11195 [Vibrio breoganii]
MELIKAILMREEGYRAKAYYCSEGYPTIGIGQKLGGKGVRLECYTFRVSKKTAMAMLESNVETTMRQLSKYPFYQKSNRARRAILVSMAYQMGVASLLHFSNMIRALEHGEYAQAEVEALDSRWYKQTPKRAKRHAEVLRTGSAEGVY